MLSFLLLLVIFSLARTRLLVLEDFGQLEKPLLGLVNEQFELEVVSQVVIGYRARRAWPK